MFIPPMSVAEEEQHLSGKTQPCVGACQEFGFENSDSDPPAFVISVVIKQQNQHSEHQKRPIFSISKKPNSSEIKCGLMTGFCGAYVFSMGQGDLLTQL